jgi:hypothetical protein
MTRATRLVWPLIATVLTVFVFGMVLVPSLPAILERL